MAAMAKRPGRLPAEWAAELERTGNTFDNKLDRYLERVQCGISNARRVKEQIDTGNAPDGARDELRKYISEIQTLLATDGRHFAEGLHKCDPAIALVQPGAGANTLELAHGIERLETAVKAEEAERRRRRPLPPARILDPRENSFEAGVPHLLGADGRALPPGTTPNPNELALPNLHADATLQLMQSDIHALKLELMRLQRAKTRTTPLPPSPGSSMSISTSLENSDQSLPTRSTGASTVTVRKMSGLQVKRMGGKPPSLEPAYKSHLADMKNRLEALESKPLSRAGRRKSHARLGRTRTMGSLYDTPGYNATLDENSNPNVSTMETPPRGGVGGSPGDIDRTNGRSSLNSTPSPAGGRKGAGARLFIDGPEELLKRPQSYAATKDIQRYSLKVARRKLVEPTPPAHVVEPRSKSAVAHSPRKRITGLGLPPADHGATLSSLASVPTVSESSGGGRVVEQLEGDLLVRKGVLWKRWRRRYASMVSHHFFGQVLCLFSYDALGGVNSARSQVIVLQDGVAKGLRDKVEVGGQTWYQFMLRTAKKEYIFAADSDEARRKWISELREACESNGTGRLASRSRLPTTSRMQS